MALALVPLLKARNLPLRYDWDFFLPIYWLVLPAQSAFCAVLLWTIGAPSKVTFLPIVKRWRTQPLRLACILVYFIALVFLSGWLKSLVVTIATFALLELFERLAPDGRKEAMISVLIPALYLFVGLLLVFSYNDIIATVRFLGQYDSLFNSMDRWLLHGMTVSSISEASVRTFPLSFFRFLEFVYYGLFALLGSGIFLTAIASGRAKAMRYIGTILTAYYVSLVVYFLWPSLGPQYISIMQSTEPPAMLHIHSVQASLFARTQAIWAGLPLHNISSDYYIAFPCMHIAQSLILLWFLKGWRRTRYVMWTYNIVLVAAIILLQWHYVVDILAGAVLAGFAVIIVDSEEVQMTISRFRGHGEISKHAIHARS